MGLLNKLLLLSAAFIALACGALALVQALQPPPQILRLAITPWPPFDYLALAAEKGYFAKQGLNVHLVELTASTDALAAFQRGQVDAIADYIGIVATHPAYTQRQARIVAITDSSRGADVILAPNLPSMAQIRGKRVAVESYALGRYVLARALQVHGISPSEITVIPGEQETFKDMLLAHQVDAVVTYLPYTAEINQAISTTTLFSSTEIPDEIFDVIVAGGDVATQIPNLGPRLRTAFNQALQYAQSHPQEVTAFIAHREDMTPPQVIDALANVHVFTSTEQQQLVNANALAAPWQRLQQLLLSSSTQPQPLAAVIQNQDWPHAP
ncbi:MAG: transporter substrate-binding domain-containing protein [Proteobacteria bacterium]|nr:transporter substrate-binding domain-containing protein [Pseudomonadota bacterium]